MPGAVAEPSDVRDVVVPPAVRLLAIADAGTTPLAPSDRRPVPVDGTVGRTAATPPRPTVAVRAVAAEVAVLGPWGRPASLPAIVKVEPVRGRKVAEAK